MSVLEKSIKSVEYAKPLSGISERLLSAPVFSPGGSVLELSMQCPYENMTPNGEHSDLLADVGFMDSIYADGPAKVAYVNGSGSPDISDEVLLDISKNVPPYSPGATSVQLGDGDPIRKDVGTGDVDKRRVWGFGVDSVENSPENSCDGGEHPGWNPHREFLEFLMEEPEEKAAASNSRKRKRKMDMVVMVDPTEDDGARFEWECNRPGEASQGAPRSKYANGTKVTFDPFPNKPAKSGKTGQNRTLVRGCISIESGSSVKPTLPPSNKKVVKKSESSSAKPFMCRESERPFQDRDSLLNDVAVHQRKEKKKKVTDVKKNHRLKDEAKIRPLHCPQCPFATDCPNDFVRHAKTHQKDKRRHPCTKCSYVAPDAAALAGHVARKHPHEEPQKKSKEGKRKAGKRSPTPHRSKKKNNKIVRNHAKGPNRAPSNKEEKSSHSSGSVKTSMESPQVKNPKKSRHSETSRLLEKDRTKTKDSSNKPPRSKSVPDKTLRNKTNPDPRPDHRGVARGALDLGEPSSKAPGDPEAKLPLDNAPLPASGIDEEPLGTLDKVEPNGVRVYAGPEVAEAGHPKRKTPAPFHNLQGRDILIDFPKCRQMFQQDSSLYLVNKRGVDAGHRNSAPVTGTPRSLDGASGPRPGVPVFSIKEEWTETEVWPEPTEPTPKRSLLTNGDVPLTLKRCPYCPALFESGIGLSNHIRGHLHRVGVSYDARHEGSTARVASGDKEQHRKVHAPPRIKKEVDVPEVDVPEVDVQEVDVPEVDKSPEQEVNLVCPLCRELFDSKKGLSNHVRGHLKRLGKSCSTRTIRSPVLVLKALMRNKQYHSKLQALKASLKERTRSSNPLGPFGLKDALIVSAAAAVQHLVESHHDSSRDETRSVQDESKTSPSSDLIGILKKRRAHEEARAKTQPQTARKDLPVPPVTEGAPPEPPPSSVSEKGKPNPRVCVHCNATFYSGVALSNHLRAYLRRKQTALLEGTTYDCSKKKQRSRSGSKKKTDPSLQTPEDLYRLTCRFCDLVFQGPLSVQEDWVKHLQRHIMNTGVAHTGVAMVEVTCLPDEPDTHTQAAV